MNAIASHSFNFRIEETKAAPLEGRFSWFSGIKKSRLVIEGLDSDVVKIAARNLTLEEGQRELAQFSLSLFSDRVKNIPVLLKGQYIQIDIDSASSRLGVSKEMLFKVAKEGRFEEFLRQESGYKFQESFKAVDEEKFEGIELLDLKKITDFINFYKTSLLQEAQYSSKGTAIRVLKISKEYLVEVRKNNDIRVYFKKHQLKTGLREVENIQSFIRFNSDEAGRFSVETTSKETSSEGFESFSSFIENFGLFDYEVELLLKSLLEEIRDLYKRGFVLQQLDCHDIYLKKSFDGHIDFFTLKKESIKAVVQSFDLKKNISELMVQLNAILISKQINSEEINLFLNALDPQESENLVSFLDSVLINLTRQVEESKAALAAKIAHGFKKAAKECSAINIDSYLAICNFIERHKARLVSQAKHDQEKIIYLNCKSTGLERALQIDADGKTFIHFNKARLGDRVLGRGSFKKVRLALEYFTNKIYAVGRTHLKSDHHKELTLNELKCLRILEGERGIARLVEEFIIKGKDEKLKSFSIQPFYYTGDLFNAITRMTVKQKVGVTIDLLHALEALQRKGVIHKDIKPENIFLRNEVNGLHAFLGDFGLSLESGNESAKKKVNGTFTYLPPEYCKELSLFSKGDHPSKVSHKLDVWALGITLFIMFMEKEPAWFRFGSDSPLVLVRAIAKLNSIDFVNTGIKVIDELIMDLMKVNPEERIDGQAALIKYKRALRSFYNAMP